MQNADRICTTHVGSLPRNAFFSRVHPSIVWAKLDALAEGARLASRELWGRQAA